MGEMLWPADDAILGHLCDTIDKMHASGWGPPPQPPSRRQIACMLNVAFATSLETEEGRKVTFNLFYTREDYPMNYKLRERAPLSPGALVRLSAALDSAHSDIAVADEGEGLAVAGIWHAGVGAVGLFAVRVVGPGVIVVRYGARLILTYRRGQFVPYEGDFSSIDDARLFLGVPGPGYSEPGRENHAVMCRFRIIDEMLRIGHGGTLLLVPSEKGWRDEVATEGFPPAAPVDRVQKAEEAAYLMWIRRQRAFAALAASDSEVGRLGQQARSEHAGRLLGGYELREQLKGELDSLARLTATDGMVLILPNLRLLGFGVFFDLGEPSCRIESHDPYERGPKEVNALSALGGARHQSAAIAADRIPGALVIVASSDGSLTAMRRENAGAPLVIHKHLELRLPGWPKYQ